jgi:hypothetical protein
VVPDTVHDLSQVRPQGPSPLRILLLAHLRGLSSGAGEVQESVVGRTHGKHQLRLIEFAYLLFFFLYSLFVPLFGSSTPLFFLLISTLIIA